MLVDGCFYKIVFQVAGAYLFSQFSSNMKIQQATIISETLCIKIEVFSSLGFLK